MNHKKIMEKISELEQRIEELKKSAHKQDEPKPFKPPEKNEAYWYFEDTLSVFLDIFNCGNIDTKRFDVGNFFPTKERAEEVTKKIRMLLKLERYHDMFCPDYVPDWSSDDTKHIVCYDEGEKQWGCDRIFISRDAAQVYFDSKETAKKVCDLLNGEAEENES